MNRNLHIIYIYIILAGANDDVKTDWKTTSPFVFWKVLINVPTSLLGSKMWDFTFENPYLCQLFCMGLDMVFYIQCTLCIIDYQPTWKYKNKNMFHIFKFSHYHLVSYIITHWHVYFHVLSYTIMFHVLSCFVFSVICLHVFSGVIILCY